jgi:hypothetical protein
MMNEKAHCSYFFLCSTIFAAFAPLRLCVKFF